MLSDLNNRVAIVTGGASGIGAAVVRQLVAQGVKIVIADVSDKGPAFAAELRQAGQSVDFIRTDISKLSDVKALVNHAVSAFGGVDLLVNSAGIFPRATLLETTEALWDRVLGINLKGVYLACQSVVPAMQKVGGGAIVNIGSLHSKGGTPNMFAYAVSKGGLVTMTRNLAQGLAADGIRVNCVNPGWVTSDGELELHKQMNFPDQWWVEAGKNLPFGRLQTPDDIASAVVFVLQHNQITGQVFDVDGGIGFNRIP